MRSLLWQLKAWFASLQGVVDVPVDPTTLPLMERVRYQYQRLDLTPFADWRLKYGQGKIVNVVHPNIDACVDDIANHIRNMEYSGHVLTSQCDYKTTNKPFNRFLIDREGFYQTSTVEKLRELKDIVLDLCKTIDEAKTVEYETKSYNLRQLSLLLTQLLDFGYALEELSAVIQNQP